MKKRILFVGTIAIVIGLIAGASVWGVRAYMHRSVSVSSKATAYLLDDRGQVNGLLLASGDQLRFSTETGTAVVAQVKVGDDVTATGHAGETTPYGREFQIEQIVANGNTIVEADPGRHDGPGGPRDRGDRADRADHGRGPADGRDDDADVATDRAPADATTGDQPKGTVETAPSPAKDQTPATAKDKTPEKGTDANANTAAKPSANTAGKPAADQPVAVSPGTTAPMAPKTDGKQAANVAPELFKAAGTIGTHLVTGRGDVNGLILSTGEQVHFPPKIGAMIIAAEKDATTPVMVQGTGVKAERGTVIRATQITVGTQTIAIEADGKRDGKRDQKGQ